MRSFVRLLLLLVCANIAFAASVTWKEYNPEKISDLKNTFFDADGKYFYSEYNADNNLWRARNNFACGADTIVAMTGVPNCERYYIGENFEYAITANGALYRCAVGSDSWMRINLPDGDYQADNVFYNGGRLFLFPRYGRVYSSDNNGVSWQEVERLGTTEAFYSGFEMNDTLYAIRSNTLYYSADNGENWLFYFPPDGLDSYIDYVINENQLFMSDIQNNVYKLNGPIFDLVTTAPKKIYGMHFVDSQNLLMFLSDGVYNYSFENNEYNKLFAFDKSIPAASSNVLKFRVATFGNCIRFALPSNEIVESADGGQTWKYIRYDSRHDMAEIIVANANEVAVNINNRIFKSNVKYKIWYEAFAMNSDDKLAGMEFDSDGNLFFGISNRGIIKNTANSTECEILTLPENYLDLLDLQIDEENIIVALSTGGLVKSATPFEEWQILNPTVNYGELRSSDNLLYWKRDGKISQVDNTGNLLSTIQISEGEKAISDIEHYQNENLFLTTANGMYKYSPNAFPLYNKVANGIFSEKLIGIRKLGSQIFALDEQNNIFASDNLAENFGVYNLDDMSVNIKSITSDNIANLYLSTEENGIWMLDNNDSEAIASDYYWINRNTYLEHSKDAEKYLVLSMTNEAGSIFASTGENMNRYDIYSGRSMHKIDFADYNLENYENYRILATAVNHSGNYCAITPAENNAVSATDSVLVINTATNNVFAKLGRNFVPEVGDEYYFYDLCFYGNNEQVLETFTVRRPLEDGKFTYLTNANLWNVESDELIKEVQLFTEEEQSGNVLTDVLLNGDNIIFGMQNVETGEGTIKSVSLSDNSIETLLTLSGVVRKVLFAKNDENVIYITGKSDEYANFSDQICLYVRATGSTLRLENISVDDVIFSADSTSIIACYSEKNEAGEQKSYLAYIDFNTLEVLNMLELPENCHGKLAVDPQTRKIIIASERLYAFADIRPSDVLSADFSADTKIAETNSDVKFYNACTGNPQEYLWNFGDGTTSNLPNPVHQFAASGVYSVELTITKNQTTSKKVKQEYIQIVDKLNIDFTADKTDGFKPLTVQFTERFSNNIVSRKWNFGDGAESDEENPQHIYQNEGQYTVVLIINNGVRSDTLTKINYINVDTVPSEYITDFTADFETGLLPLEVTFTPLTTPSSTYWEWNFGDGTTSNETSPTHVYTDYGNYTVSLKAGKEQYFDTETKERYIKISRGNIDGINVVEEYELNYVGTNREGLSAGQTSTSVVGFDVVADSSDNEFSEMGILNPETKQITFYNLAGIGQAPTPRYLAPLRNDNFAFVTSTFVNNYSNLKIVRYNKMGESFSTYSDRRNQNILPLATLADGEALLVASVANDTTLRLSKFDASSRFEFDKDFNHGKTCTNTFVKIMKSGDYYWMILKENDGELAKLIKLAANGDSLAQINMFENAYYHVADAYFDSNQNLIVAGSYRFLTELDPVYSFVAKYDANNEQVWYNQFSGSIELTSIDETVGSNERKKYIAGGSIDGNVGFVAFDESGAKLNEWKFLNRLGKFNDVITLQNNDLLLTGYLYNQKNKKNFYCMQVSSENSYSGVKENKNDAMLISPNPSHGVIEIQTETAASLRIFDVSGKMVFEKSDCELVGEIDLSNLPNGTYTAVVTNGKQAKSGKFVIFK